VLLINAVKDVASALSVLIDSTKNAAGKALSGPDILILKDSAKVTYRNSSRQANSFTGSHQCNFSLLLFEILNCK